MSSLAADMARIWELTGDAFSKAGNLAAITGSDGSIYPQKLQKSLEQILESFEQAAMELRVLAERNCPGVGGYGNRPVIPAREVTGSVSILEYSWLHFTLNTLLPHCRYQTPAWLSDTIRRLLDDYEASGGSVPFFPKGAALILDEHSDIQGRHIYDQDNKGWKAVSNALKGRVIPDDDQYDLFVFMLASRSRENVTHITLLDVKDAADFLSRRCAYSDYQDVYGQI